MGPVLVLVERRGSDGVVCGSTRVVGDPRRVVPEFLAETGRRKVQSVSDIRDPSEVS